MSKSQFPWEILKAECLRTICTQLMQSTGAHYSEVRRREDMITFLNDVEKNGLDKAAQTLQEDIKPGGKLQAQRTTSPAKRKAEATEEEPSAEDGDGDGEGADGYNTRYKGVKRVKVRAATPEGTRSPRKNQTASASAPNAGGAESASAGPPVKRGRGRPRKSLPADNVSANPTSAAAGDQQPVSAVKRGRGRPRKSAVPAPAPADDDDDSEYVDTTAKSASEFEDNKQPVVSTGKRGRGRPRKSDVAAKTAESEAEGNTQPISIGKRGRGRPRKSDAAPVAPAPAPAPAATSAAASSGEPSAKRPRGRPRKHPLPAAGASTAPTSKGKQVFDGVLMQKRISPAKGSAPAAERAGEADEGYEEDAPVDDENDDPVLRNGHVDDGSSSLGGSNKENEPTFTEYTPERDVQDVDAAGEPDTNTEEATVTEMVQIVDFMQSTVIMPTIPMALAAAASNSAAAESRANSIPQDRPVLHPL